MGLSNDLLAQFAKVTKSDKTSKKDTVAYGEVVKRDDGSVYVKLDGSEILTPVNTTTDVADGERVAVSINNHIATITGNISSPSINISTPIDKGDGTTTNVGKIGSEIKVLSNQISTLVRDGSGQSLMEQTPDGWVFSIGDLENSLNTLLSHIKIGTYEGQICLELVVDNGSQKLLLTGDKIRFMESDTTAAYISGDTMSIENAAVAKKLDIGDETTDDGAYRWAVQDNTLNLLWEEYV